MPVTQSDAIQASAVFRLNSITLRRSTRLGFDIRTSRKHESAAESICNRRTGGADDDNLDHTKLFTTQGLWDMATKMYPNVTSCKILKVFAEHNRIGVLPTGASMPNSRMAIKQRRDTVYGSLVKYRVSTIF